MTDPTSEDTAEPEPTIAVAAPEEALADVAFVVPAPVIDAIATDDDLDRAMGPTPAAPPFLDLSPALEAIAAVEDKLDALAQAFDREIRAEATREKIVDRLHAELQEYKQDLVLSLMKPVFLDLIQLHDDVGKMAAAGAGPDAGPGSLAAMAEDVRQGITDILYRQGVEPFTSDRDEFDARRQRAIQTISTEDPELARKVAGRLRPGFVAGEKAIRPEVVSVYALKRP